jgi:ADP-heptose:LPS heptosyltransferase
MTLDPESLDRILVVRLSSLGDVVRITGLLASLRVALPRAEIVVATGSGAAPLLAMHPAIDRLLLAKRPTRRRLAFAWEAWRRLAPLRRDGGFDLALDLHGTRPSAVWTRLSRARVKARRGGPGAGWAAQVPMDMTRADDGESFLLLRKLGLELPYQPPRLYLDPAADAAVSARLAAAGLPQRGYILVSPFSRWTAKDWPVDHYARLLPALAAASGRPLLLSGGRGAAAASDMDRLRALLPPGIASLAGAFRVEGLMALVARAGLVISGDSGPMHIAAALGRPQVALFGPTWPERAGPAGWERAEGPIRLLQYQRLPAYHAYQVAANQAAMGAIPVETVLAAALDLLARAESTAA